MVLPVTALILMSLFWVLIVCPLTGRKIGGIGLGYAGSVAVGAWFYSAVLLALAFGVSLLSLIYLALFP